ncbi:MAG TPA: alpha-hydroxy acid oxidase [Burkholderiales bacterium]|nr:alpha-hydroxy acid oxidase [Burkholderiales bacterium]
MPSLAAHNIADLQRAAHRRLPSVVWRYIEGGAEDEVTLRANRAAFEQIHFTPRTLVDVSQRSQKVTVLGLPYDSPFGIAPMGPLGICRYLADISLARAARAANVPFTLSIHAFVSLARVAAASGGAPWVQVYLPADRGRAQEELAHVRAAGCEVLMLTTDVPVRGNREYNTRAGFDVPLRPGLRTVAEGLMHPRWLIDVYLRSLAGRRIRHSRLRRDMHDWRDFDWLRAAWPGKLVVKGILSAEDARLAAQHGADGVLVSNHGGRQLDGAPSPIEVLPSILAAVRGRVAVFVDGGIRRGADIVKALAMGADMAFVGRAALYGVAAGGEEGASRALHILRSEIDRVLALLGCNSIAELGPHCIGRGGIPGPEPRPQGTKPTVVRIAG